MICGIKEKARYINHTIATFGPGSTLLIPKGNSRHSSSPQEIDKREDTAQYGISYSPP